VDTLGESAVMPRGILQDLLTRLSLGYSGLIARGQASDLSTARHLILDARQNVHLLNVLYVAQGARTLGRAFIVVFVSHMRTIQLVRAFD